MIRSIKIAGAIFVFSAPPIFGQGGNPPPAPRATEAPMVIGPTGTMHDGNNANLQLPSEENAYWARLWSEPGATGNAVSAPAVGAGAAGTSFGGAQTGGQH